MQPRNQILSDDRQERHLDIQMVDGPNLAKLDSIVSAEIRPIDRAEQVRAKMTDDERRNLRITVLYTRRDVGDDDVCMPV